MSANLTKNISLTDDEEEKTEEKSEEHTEEDTEIEKQKKKRVSSLKIENLTEEQYDKINDLINDVKIKGITKRGNVRKMYTMTDKKKNI